MKTELTIEQSQKLIELGVDAKLASKRWSNFYHGITSEELKICPLFGLSDLLSILPKEIDGNVISIISIGFNPKTEELDKGWTVTYVTDHFIPAFGDNPVFSAPELIDALNQLLIWTIEQGYFNTEKR